MLLRKLYYKLRYRRRNKVYKMPKAAQKKIFEELFPDTDGPPLVQLAKNTGKKVDTDPEFKFFSNPPSCLDEDRKERLKHALALHDEETKSSE